MLFIKFIINCFNSFIYTNETVALVAKKLFPLVGGLSSLVAKGPKDLAAKLDKEACAGAIAALNAAAATLGADGKPVDKLEAWQYLTVVDGDFGFANGDKEGFLEATVEQALKRPELRDRFMAYLMHTVGPLLAEEKTEKK